MRGRRFGHREPALADEGDRLVVRQRLRRSERRELADGVADDEVCLDPAVAQGSENRQRGGDEGRLLHGGVHELLGIGVEAEPLEVEAARRATALENRHRGGRHLGEVATHAGLERALPWETEGDLVHAAASSVQRISALPHVRPAPIPVMRTRLPGRSLPSTRASASASGIEPDDVFP